MKRGGYTVGGVDDCDFLFVRRRIERGAGCFGDGSSSMRALRTLILAWTLFAGWPAYAPAYAQAPSCSKSDFEAVVDSAAAALRDLNLKNRPVFQEKLRELKAKRAWSDDQFMKEAAPLVKDAKTDTLDSVSSTMLAKITAMGEAGAAAKSPDCALMTELNGYMQQLVTAQTDKWTYLFEKLAAEMAK